jgi:hypothetical protein
LGTDWGILGNPKMNIRQAKARFTELTGLPAKQKAIFTAIRQYKGSYRGWVLYYMDGKLAEEDCLDTRRKACWVSLVNYLESLQEVV